MLFFLLSQRQQPPLSHSILGISPTLWFLSPFSALVADKMGCGGFAGMVVVGVGLPAWVGGGPILVVGLWWLWVVDFVVVVAPWV